MQFFLDFLSEGVRGGCACFLCLIDCCGFVLAVRAASRVISMSAHASLDPTCLLLCKTRAAAPERAPSFSRLISSAECCACFFFHTRDIFNKMAIEGGRATTAAAATVFTVVVDPLARLPPLCTHKRVGRERNGERPSRRNVALRDLSGGPKRARVTSPMRKEGRRQLRNSVRDVDIYSLFSYVMY